jgi:integrase
VRGDRLYALWLVYATTGMRRGEALALRWADLDLEASRATITETVGSVAYAVVRGRPKSDRSRRSVALDPGTVAALRAHRKAQAAERLALGPAYADGGLVFTCEDGTPLHPERVSRLFDGRVRDSGLPRIRLHDVRHTWATLALRAGVPLKVVSEHLGHTSIAVTADTYMHVSAAMERDAAETVAALVLDVSNR